MTQAGAAMCARIAPAAMLLSATLLAAACSRTAPVYNVQDRPIPVVAQKLSLDEIGQDIMSARRRRHWRMDPIGPGRMTGRLDDRQHEAVIDISYTRQSYSITLADSMNLRQEGDEVHKKYNKWIRLLQKEIDDRLYSAGLASK